MKDKHSKVEQALYYLKEKRWSIIPVGQDKKPLIPWKQFQNSHPTQEQVQEWFSNEAVNIGIVTGKVSNLTVVDIDPRHGGTNESFEGVKTVTARTGGFGWHYYFSFEDGIQNHTSIQQGVDLRGEGGYVIAPPSSHPSGNKYSWEVPPTELNVIALLPSFVKEWINQAKPKDSKSNWNPEVLKGVQEGKRNDTAASITGKLLKRFPEKEWESEAWEHLKSWNLSKNKEPLEEAELRKVFESIRDAELEIRQDKETPVALKIIEDVSATEAILFHDEHKDCFIAPQGDGREILALDSKQFELWITRYMYQNGLLPTNDILQKVTRAFKARALFDGSQHELHVRIAEYENAYWYDLGNGTAVRTVKEGWAVVNESPILFRRFNHQHSQVQPERGGDLHDLVNFINVTNDEERLLFLVFTVACFIPDFPHPILVLHGPQGAGKTTPLRLLKSLIDPSVLKTLTAPDGVREFVQIAAHHYFIFLDNLSHISDSLSDALARAVTGDGFSKRQLYTDSDDIIFTFQRSIGLNGINLVVQKADLLDRSILLALERIPKEKRREEQEFWKELETKKPYLLGAIFDAVAGALKIYPTISLDSYPRMADFTRWGVAIAKALGYSQEDFLNAYYHNINKQNDEAIDASPVGTALIAYMENRESWEGPASDLLSELEKLTDELKINRASRDWPKSASTLSRRLQLVQANLAERGINVIRHDKARPRKITIQKSSENADGADMSTEQSKNDKSTPEIVEQKADISADGITEQW